MSSIGQVKVSSQAASNPINITGATYSVGQYLTSPFSIGVVCAISSGGSLTYTLQVTL